MNACAGHTPHERVAFKTQNTICALIHECRTRNTWYKSISCGNFEELAAGLQRRRLGVEREAESGNHFVVVLLSFLFKHNDNL